MHGWQVDKRRTCALPVVGGLCPKMKYHPLWVDFYYFKNDVLKKYTDFPTNSCQILQKNLHFLKILLTNHTNPLAFLPDD